MASRVGTFRVVHRPSATQFMPAPVLRALFLCVCASVPTVPAVAQCPDGAPPPCRGATARAANPNSIAVLYFDNLSRDSADAYLADGLTDELIVRLQHVQRLDVKSRNEVRRFRGSGVPDSRALGRELHVAWLVNGSVRPSASRMRVSYELVRTSDGRTMASDIVDTTSADQWAISNGIALSIARAVAGRLAPEESAALVRGGSRDAQAVDLYRRGMYLQQRAKVGHQFDALMAQAFFRAAIERDSTYADAWASMAVTWAWVEGLFPNRVVAERGRTAARRALALDSASDAGAMALSYALATVDYDWAGAERVVRRAIALNPRAARSLQMLSALLTATGRFDAAGQLVESAWIADSLDPGLGWFVGIALVGARRYGDVARWDARAPGNWGLRFWAHLGAGRADSALASAGSDLYLRAIALAAAGRLDAARAAAQQAQAADDSARAEGQVVGEADQLAMAWAAVGDLDRAFAALDISYRVRSGMWLIYIKVWPGFDGLRDDLRYHDLLRRMHLEP
jgi:adenylate cyclase